MNEKIMETAGFGEKVKMVKAGLCPFCGNIPVSFRNEKSQREYRISGLCQTCQDETFGVD